jgi:hypothetical protein
MIEMMLRHKALIAFLALISSAKAFAQEEDLLKLVGDDKAKKEYVYQCV